MIDDPKLTELRRELQELKGSHLDLSSRVTEMQSQRLRDIDVQETRDRMLESSLREIREMLERRGEKH